MPMCSRTTGYQVSMTSLQRNDQWTTILMHLNRALLAYNEMWRWSLGILCILESRDSLLVRPAWMEFLTSYPVVTIAVRLAHPGRQLRLWDIIGFQHLVSGFYMMHDAWCSMPWVVSELKFKNRFAGRIHFTATCIDFSFNFKMLVLNETYLVNLAEFSLLVFLFSYYGLGDDWLVLTNISISSHPKSPAHWQDAAASCM